MVYVFSNILGTFVFGDDFRLVESAPSIDTISKKYPNAKQPEAEALKRILDEFKKESYSKRLHDLNMELTKKGIQSSLGDEMLVIEAINNIDDIRRVTSALMKRLREWYALYDPELERDVPDNSKFLKLILSCHKPKKGSMGALLQKSDLEPMLNLTKSIESLGKLELQQEKYLERVMERLCPNVCAVADPLIGARLLVHARSLKRLSMLPASTIQLLGAEQALFRHLRTGAKAPRHGLIVAHPLLASAPQHMHGKIARALADKISIAAKVDYFKGEFIGNTLRKGLEAKFGK